jgi:hypothetical protein
MKKMMIMIALPFIGTFMGNGQQYASGEFQDGILLQQIKPDGPLIISSAKDHNRNPAGMGYMEALEHLRSRVARSETENSLELTQHGNDNMVNLNQGGIKNAIEITQRGNANSYEGVLKGEDNLIYILQSGHYNTLYQMLEGNGTERQVTQQGTGHELIQIETGKAAPAYQVHQRGEGMSVIIEHR